MKGFISKIGSIFKTDEQVIDFVTPESTEATFFLKHNDIAIGVLTLKEGFWIFRYTEDFKKQKTLSAIVDFPNINKEYKSTDLFPYFSYRIPSTGRPQIRKAIEQNKLDENNIVELLRHFGRRTIVNPFELHPA